jgi:hypothetical protein
VPESQMPSDTWNDYVFRFRLRNPLAKGTSIDAKATVQALASRILAKGLATVERSRH